MHDKQEHKFDSELQTYYEEIKQRIREQHILYAKTHPQLRQILNDFLSSLLLEQPDNVYDYARQYFSYFNIDKDRLTFHPLVLTGLSGSGKSSLAKELVRNRPDLFEMSIRFTTKEPTEGEVHGKDYYFVSQEEFRKDVSKGAFAQFSLVQGHYFGNHKGKVKDIVFRGKVCVIDIDFHGALQIIEALPGANFVFLEVGTAELQKRMKAANTPDEVRKAKLELARQESQEAAAHPNFHRLQEDSLQATTHNLLEHLKTVYPSAKI